MSSIKGYRRLSLLTLLETGLLGSILGGLVDDLLWCSLGGGFFGSAVALALGIEIINLSKSLAYCLQSRFSLRSSMIV